MLTEFMQVWNKDSSRWVDAVLKTATAESAENKAQLETWITNWKAKVIPALKLLSEEMLGAEALATAEAALDKRLAKAGLFK